MLFNSLEFLLLFMPAALGIALRLRGRALVGFIAFASLVFYAFAGHAWFLIPMAITTVLDFVVGGALGFETRPRYRRALLLSSLLGNLGLLVYFKYARLLATLAEDLSNDFASPLAMHWLNDVVLPAGISFYTFQTISYVVDIYRGHARPEPDFLKYVAFVTFFPHLVAGPLTRHNQLIPQLSEIMRTGIAPRWKAGLLLFSIGLAKKVLIADRLANMIDPMIAAVPRHGFVGAWLALLGYSLQIYFDFSGYSDMAIGLGRLFQIELPSNFDSPYRARDPRDFWRRWHMTLSRWLRDYLYIPLGGNRRGRLRTYCNMIITMVLGGLWHGANWTFAVWGLFHGVVLVAHDQWSKPWDRLPVPARTLLTYLLVTLGWVFFRSETLSQACSWIAGLGGARGMGLIESLSPKLLLKLSTAITAGLTIACVGRNSLELDLDALRPRTAGVIGAVTGVSILLMNYSSRFLYFQF
jgi:alginate O-acetyltransferase complex protein AlgI